MAAKSDYALQHGSDGLIPSTGNLITSIYHQMELAVANKDLTRTAEMQELSDSFGNLYQAGRTLGNSLWALKVLMYQKGLCDPNMMPPLQAGSKEETASLIESFQELSKNTRGKFKSVS